MNEQAVVNNKRVVCEYGDSCERAYVVRPLAFFRAGSKKIKVTGKRNLVEGGAVITLCAAGNDAETCSALLRLMKRAGGVVPMERDRNDYYTTVNNNLVQGRQLMFCPESLFDRHTVTQEESYKMAAHAGVPVVPVLLTVQNGVEHLSIQTPVYPCGDLSEQENADYMLYVARTENKDAHAAQIA